MSEVKRYNSADIRVWFRGAGLYVAASDYDTLKAQLDEAVELLEWPMQGSFTKSDVKYWKAMIGDFLNQLKE
jgi:hypothetical protein